LPDGTLSRIAQLPGPIKTHAESPDGRFAIYACWVHPLGQVMEVNLDDGATRLSFEPVPFGAFAEVDSLTYAGPEAIAAGSMYFIYLVDRATGSVLDHVKCKCAAGGLYSVRNGRALIARTIDGATKTFVYATDGGKMRVVAKLKVELTNVREAEGRILAGDYSGEQEYELVNLDAALAEPPKSKAKPKKKPE
jgi:hypothetical protein